MKTEQELNELKNEVAELGKKLSELTEEELKQVTGGTKVVVNNEDNIFLDIINWFFKIKK